MHDYGYVCTLNQTFLIPDDEYYMLINRNIVC